MNHGAGRNFGFLGGSSHCDGLSDTVKLIRLRVLAPCDRDIEGFLSSMRGDSELVAMT